MIKVITDSCSDLSKELRTQYNIDYVAMNVVIDGEEKRASLDWEEISPQDFYEMMRNGKRIKTTQVPMNEYQTVFSNYLRQGYDIIYVACSSALSKSIDTAKLIASQLNEEFPKNKIYCLDSLNACYGEGMIALEAAKQVMDGKSFEEIIESLEETKLCYNQFCSVDTLSYLQRAGRVSAGSAFFGNIIGVKPIIISDANGTNYAHKKIKGKKSAMEECVNELRDCLISAGIDPTTAELYTAHADTEKDIETFEKMIREEVNPKSIYRGFIGPIIGASVGPGAYVVYCYGKKVEVKGE